MYTKNRQEWVVEEVSYSTGRTVYKETFEQFPEGAEAYDARTRRSKLNTVSLHKVTREFVCRNPDPERAYDDIHSAFDSPLDSVVEVKFDTIDCR